LFTQSVRPQKFKDTPRDQKRNLDRVARRVTQVDVLAQMKEERVRRDRRYPESMVVQCTFTLTPELDAEIHDAAQRKNCSRSAVVRQALIFYFDATRPAG
jgi:hypothetical protein